MARKAKAKTKPTAEKAIRKTGRPPEPIPKKLAQELLDCIADGQTLSSWCRKRSKPAARTVRDWKAKDLVFAAAYAHAREVGGDLIADRMRETAETRTKHRDDVNHRRLKIDTDKWLLARWFPTRYGDRVALAGADDAPPIQISDEDALRRIAMLLSIAAMRKEKAKK